MFQDQRVWMKWYAVFKKVMAAESEWLIWLVKIKSFVFQIRQPRIAEHALLSQFSVLQKKRKSVKKRQESSLMWNCSEKDSNQTSILSQI